MSEWTIRLPWSRPPISANDRLHWRAKAHRVANIREVTRNLVNLREFTGDRLPTDAEHITVGLVYTPRDKRRRDADNLVVPFMKALVDGLVDARVVADDDDKHVTRLMPVIAEPDGDPRIELIIRTN